MFMRQLTYLIALDRHRHFGRAAESCHVSQPALSTGISELERELDIIIVKRNRSFQGITPEGERVIAWARQSLASLEGLRQEADLGRSIPGGHLAIGVVPSALHPATLLSAKYRQAIARLTLDIRSLSTLEILQGLKSQDLHLGVTYAESVDESSHDAMPLFSERYVLVSGMQASLPPGLDWADVAGLPLCLLSQEMQNRRMLDQVFAVYGVKPLVVVESNALRVLLSETLSGRAFSIMPLSALPPPYVSAGLRIHAIAPEHRAEVSLIRLKRDKQPPLSEAAWRLATGTDLQEILDQPLTLAR